MTSDTDLPFLSDASLARMLSETGNESVREEAARRLRLNASTVYDDVIDDVDSLEREAKAIQFCRIVQELGTRPGSEVWFCTPETVKDRYRALAKVARRARAHAPRKAADTHLSESASETGDDNADG